MTMMMMMGRSSKVVAILPPVSAITSKLYRSVSWNSAAVSVGRGAIFSTAHDVRLHPSSSVQQQILLMRSASSTSQRSLYLSLPTTIHNNSSSVNHYDSLSSSNNNCRFQWRHFARDRGGRRVHYPRNKDGLNGKSHSSNNYKNNNDDQFGKYSFGDADRGIIETKENKKKILVVGSAGILGKTLVSHFGGDKCNWDVVGADVVAWENNDSPTPVMSSKALGLSEYICLPRESSLADLTGELFRGVSTYLQLPSGRREKREKDNLFDAIVCTSGGWAGDVDLADYLFEMSNTGASGDVDVEEGFATENAEICECMMRMNYYPIVAASQIGRRFMKRGGLFVIIGASAALSPTPGMIGYGSAKSAAHHLIQSWGPTCHEENNTTAVGILPLMIDTPANRAMLGGGDEDGGGNDDRYSKMVKPILIANEIGEWIKQPHLRPHSGSLVKVIAKNRKDGSGGAAFHLVR